MAGHTTFTVFVIARTLLPVLMPLAPASTVITRFPSELATLLATHGANQAFVTAEVAGMSEVSVAKTANRSVVGTMNEFAFLAEVYREYRETTDLLVLSMRLAETPCSAIKYSAPSEMIKDVLRASPS